MNNLNDFLSKLHTIKNEEIRDFVNKRIFYLENNTKSREISIFNPIIKGYITSNSPVYAHILYQPMYLDDKDIYTEYLNYLKANNASSFVKIVILTHNFVLGKTGIENSFNKRKELYSNTSNNLSIKDFYNSNSAFCIEKTVLFNNLLSFCNITHYTIFGQLNSDNNDGHVFSIVSDLENNKNILLDIENPVILNDNNIITVVPSTNVLDKNKIINNTYVFDYKKIENMYSSKLAENQAKNQERIYCFPDEFLKIVYQEPDNENRKLILENKEG